ncbi:hypothetical protein LV780_04780 [Cereibacter azotoformans]|uniref:hypothetical protein n=1 Tax=Cereibacter azotoformans TaxID=43057 RepID=UPI000E3589A0|nr:hypothetical protein [Cereibacter azotoformans]AXQ93184.1 hypothetical protein D0Z66_04770 [Cereibacter sphaeroides]UIJ31495.1 hypothetical protein LV780_04780 [Cereibacter azotoformans]
MSRLIFWHLAGRFNEARSNRAFSKHLRLKEKAMKYFSRIERAAPPSDDDAPEFDRILPSGWWLVPAVIIGTGIAAIVMWAAVSALVALLLA